MSDTAADPPCLDCARKDRVIRQQQIQNRQLVDELNDAEENVRVYRRLCERFAVELNALRAE